MGALVSIPALTPEAAKLLAKRMGLPRKQSAVMARKMEILSTAIAESPEAARAKFGDEAVQLDLWMSQPLDPEVRLVRTRHEAGLADRAMRVAEKALCTIADRLETPGLFETKDLIDCATKLMDKATKFRDVHQRMLDSEREFAGALADRMASVAGGGKGKVTIRFANAGRVEDDNTKRDIVIEKSGDEPLTVEAEIVRD